MPDLDTSPLPSGWEFVDTLDDVILTEDGLCDKCLGKYAAQ